MENPTQSRRLIELLYMRERTMQRLRRSPDLAEVWRLYQEAKLLTQYIDQLQKLATAISA